MMIINKPKLLTTAPHSRNPVFTQEVRVGCVYCHRYDKRCKKSYSSLYSLFKHFTNNHKTERDYMEKITQLAELVIEGSLR